MPKTDCHTAFRMGLERRKLHQLPSGVYKLSEVQGWYSSMVEDVSEIIKFKKRHTHRPCLNHCTTEDMAHWLKKIPGNIAFDLGYYMLPAVAALEGDNLPHHVVTAMIARFTLQAHPLVDSCQEVHDSIRKSIALEYSLMSQGESSILDLLLRTESLFGAALSEAGQYATAKQSVGA